MNQRLQVLVLCMIIFSGIAGCDKTEKAKVINLEEREAAETQAGQHEEKPLRIAVGGMITPREGFAYYRQFLDYIGEKLGRHVDFVDREDYAEINKMVKAGDVDVAFVCGGPYVDGHDQFGMQLLVAPVAYGRSVYYSYIIVPSDSPVESFNGLEGKSFAFTDPLSNTGTLVPMYMLAKMNETPDSFFEKYAYTNAHDKSIKAVAQKIVDGAAVDSLIWEYANRVNPEYTSRTKIIEKSPPYGIPPVVVRPGLDPKAARRLKEIFLNAHREKRGKAILNRMMIDKFIEIDDSAYDSIREMKRWLAGRSNGTRK